jgi:hypothetical protein
VLAAGAASLVADLFRGMMKGECDGEWLRTQGTGDGTDAESLMLLCIGLSLLVPFAKIDRVAWSLLSEPFTREI